MKTRRRVLVVDDDADQQQTLRRGLFLAGIESVTSTAAATPALLADFDLVLADLTRPGRVAVALVERAHAARLPVLVITGLALTPEVASLRARGVPILRKPFTADELGSAIETLLKGEPS